MGKKVMIAVDDGDESTHALRWTLEYIVRQSDEVLLFHSQPIPSVYAGPAGPGGFYIAPEVLLSMEQRNKQLSEVILQNAKKITQEKQIDPTLLASAGDPRDTICDAVEKLHPDVLVMGSHGYGAIKRAFLGSVSDYCVHYAKCSVLVVKK